MPAARRLGRGVLAGLAGTAAMTAWQELSSRLMSSDGESSGDDGPSDPWKSAPVPAQVARRFSLSALGRDPSPDLIPALTNGMHWAYGTGWGVVYGLVRGHRAASVLRAGAIFGTAVWASSYAQLVPLGLYEPPWTYSPSEVALDLSYHLVYGTGVAAGFNLAAR